MTLLKPLPIYATDNRGNCTSGYSILFRQLTHEYVALGITLAYFRDLLRRQLCNPVRFAAWLALLGYFISNVVVIRSGKKMCWIAAQRIVAAVENMKTIRDRAIRKDIGDAVRVILPKVPTVAVKAVAVLVLRPLPFPAVIWAALGDSCPESFRVVGRAPALEIAVRDFVRGMIGVHENLHSRAMPPDVHCVAVALLLVNYRCNCTTR